MAQLVFSGTPERRYLIQKRIVTIGTEPGHDWEIVARNPGIVFTLSFQEGRYEIFPGQKIRVNGQPTLKNVRLASCDRIEWDGGSAVFLAAEIADSTNAAAAQSGAIRSLVLLQNLASTLQGPGSIPAALHQTLDALVEMAGAEAGYLLTENAEGSSWNLAATSLSFGDAESSENLPRSRKELLSNTILQETLNRREPVYVENIIGHPWGEAASVIEARIFSAACFPLCVAERIFGAVFLCTRSPGRSIKREALSELSLLASQAALMLASQAELKTARRENARLRSLVPDKTENALAMDSSSPMNEIARKIQKVARTDLSVLVLGETGTGKEIAAREIHRQSTRAQGPFVAVNCAAIPGPLLESTLFGFEKGAFTGAIRSQKGKFALADGGTLFLDEIGDLPLELQAKILRVLQERIVEPLGAGPRDTFKADLRIVAATHQDLDAAVKAAKFRQDLYFRLNGSTIRIPPLRERKNDIRVLAELFLARTGRGVALTPAAGEALLMHSWPGNVRELEQTITRAALLCETAEIQPAELELDAALAAPESGAGTAFVWAAAAGLSGNLDDAQEAFTREFVQKALERCSGSREVAATQLGISERTLYRILAKTSGQPHSGADNAGNVH